MPQDFQIEYFAAPVYLTLLLLVPAYLVWYKLWFAPKRLIIHLSYDPNTLKRPKWNLTWLRHVPIVLQLLGISLLILALARPQSAQTLNIRNTQGIDIMLLLDTSGSMETQDFTPNRLEVAKKQAKRFVEGREGDRIGMVLFAEDAFSYAPLTLDYSLLFRLIDGINFTILPKQGTAIGSAIATGINRLKESESPSRIMILLTDGASNRGQIDPITAAKLAREFKVRIYCIGIGRAKNSGSNPTPLNSELDEVTLKKIAQITDGTYFRADDKERLAGIFDSISKLEKQSITEENFRQVTDYYPIFLKIALGLLATSFLLMVTFVFNPLEI
ncbi:MAG: VWA domain-containing protein [Bacteroidota bacterium]